MARTPEPDVEPDDDSDALHWAGDEARGRDEPRLAKPATASDGLLVDDGGEADAVAARANPVRLVGTGIFAGLFLAYTVGWILAVQAIPSTAVDVFGEVMWQFGEFLAIVASALWFGATLLLTRERSTGVRFGWLALGIVLLFPWPVVWGFLV